MQLTGCKSRVTDLETINEIHGYQVERRVRGIITSALTCVLYFCIQKCITEVLMLTCAWLDQLSNFFSITPWYSCPLHGPLIVPRASCLLPMHFFHNPSLQRSISIHPHRPCLSLHNATMALNQKSPHLDCYQRAK